MELPIFWYQQWFMNLWYEIFSFIKFCQNKINQRSLIFDKNGRKNEVPEQICKYIKEISTRSKSRCWRYDGTGVQAPIMGKIFHYSGRIIVHNTLILILKERNNLVAKIVLLFQNIKIFTYIFSIILPHNSVWYSDTAHTSSVVCVPDPSIWRKKNVTTPHFMKD